MITLFKSEVQGKQRSNWTCHWQYLLAALYCLQGLHQLASKIMCQNETLLRTLLSTQPESSSDHASTRRPVSALFHATILLRRSTRSETVSPLVSAARLRCLVVLSGGSDLFLYADSIKAPTEPSTDERTRHLSVRTSVGWAHYSAPVDRSRR